MGKPINCKNITFSVTKRNPMKPPPNSWIVRIDGNGMLCSDKKLSLKNGMKSLGKKLGLDEIPVRLNMRNLPGDFFRTIHPDWIDTDRCQVFGMISKEALKFRVKAEMTKQKNAEQTKALMETGAVKAVRDGHFSVNDLSRVQQGEEIIREADEAAKKLELDVLNGRCVKFKIRKTKKVVRIVSHKEEDDSAVHQPAIVEENGDIDLDLTIQDMCFVKRKHYFLYSDESGYGKSTVLSSLEKRCNCSPIQDFNNLTGVRENAQFLTNDEFSHSSKITVDQLKALTGGKPDSFVGNKKSFGRGFKPRRDVQVILASNYHPFQCVGSKFDQSIKTRTMHHQTAKQLFDRFHIIKFDDEKTGELEQGAACLAVDDGRYEDFFEDDDADLEEFVIANRELVERFRRLIKDKTYRSKKGKKRKNMDDDEEEEEDLESDGEYLGLSEFDSRGRRLNKPLYRRFLNNLARRWSWKDEK